MRMIALRPKDCCRAQEEDDPLAMTASEPSYASSSVTRPSITSIASRRYHRSRSRFAPWNTSMLAEAWRRMPLRQSRAWALPARHATCAKLRRGYSPSAKYSALILRRRCRIASMPPGYSSGLVSTLMNRTRYTSCGFLPLARETPAATGLSPDLHHARDSSRGNTPIRVCRCGSDRQA